MNYSLTSHSVDLGEHLLSTYTLEQRRLFGQFLTPPPIARHMARLLRSIPDGSVILDPSMGSGTLSLAVIERLIDEKCIGNFSFIGYEIDPNLARLSRETLRTASMEASKHGIHIHWSIFEDDFIDANNRLLNYGQASLFQSEAGLAATHIIANPPYFKLNRNDPRVLALNGAIEGDTNIYTLFMGLCLRILTPLGIASFIVPRSFTSGSYFTRFRQDFIRQAVPLAVHLFESRDETFESVLQENLIITFRKRHPQQKKLPEVLLISTSRNGANIENCVSRRIKMVHFLSPKKKTSTFRLPTGELDETIIETLDHWKHNLTTNGMDISTGLVVPFRNNNVLADLKAYHSGKAYPLLWMQHVGRQKVIWPLNLHKPEAIARDAQELLITNNNYVLLRRFSAKEDIRRLIAAPFLKDHFSSPAIGFENHINVIRKKYGELSQDEAEGLSALLNSSLLDRYVRITSGNTQINAQDIRNLPLPPLEIIKNIGRQLRNNNSDNQRELIVISTLKSTNHLPSEFPIIEETRISMGKIQEAQQILLSLGLPEAQRNEVSALTLLVLGQLSENTPWNQARVKDLRIHDILIEIKQRYGREYAENTRETIRRQVIHQFEQAGLVIRNPNEPMLSTNSPRTHYALSDQFIEVLTTYGTNDWDKAIKQFAQKKGSLLELYRKARDQNKIPLRLPNGEEFLLSPGAHNQLQVDIVNEFAQRFASGAQLIYLGDTAHKTLVYFPESFAKLGVLINDHDKLPDVVFFDEDSNALFLVEAVISHGPVTPKRFVELENIFQGCTARRIYVSAFPNFSQFKDFLHEIAWETEVWLAEIPDHMIHFNGDRFLKSAN